jgi:CRISPR system Cascade subunit CasC
LLFQNKETTMFIELHLIQNFAPANLNRDDTGNPKDCEFGGVRRARISSQCLKRATRSAPIFSEITGAPNAQRTKRFVDKLTTLLIETGKPDVEAQAVVTAFLPAFASKLDGKDPKLTAVLLYFSEAELQGIVDALAAAWPALADDTKRADALKQVTRDLIKQYKARTSAPDIALFGRMLAEKPELNIDAACQVAHAISTHRVAMEMDFYTAVDDLRPDDTAGSAMMGFTAYDSACFYRYLRLDWEQLVKNLDQDISLARRTVEGFLRAAVVAIPTGKQNSFAAQNPPAFMLAVVKPSGMAWSLANAFERPVRAHDGLTGPSVAALDRYWERLVAVYGLEPGTQVAVLALEDDLPLKALQDSRVPTMQAWVETVLEAVPTVEA